MLDGRVDDISDFGNVLNIFILPNMSAANACHQLNLQFHHKDPNQSQILWVFIFNRVNNFLFSIF